MDSYWRIKRKSHKEVLTQWVTCLKALNIGVIYALSPQAKGKVERPYRWIQDHLVRLCAKNNVKNIADAQNYLDEDIYRYNSKTVHSTTGEIPDVRFKKALISKNISFKPFKVPPPYRSANDVFCLREPRIVDGYQSVSWNNRKFKVPKHVPIGATVILHIIPDNNKPMIRIWWNDKGTSELIDAIFMGPTNKT